MNYAVYCKRGLSVPVLVIALGEQQGETQFNKLRTLSLCDRTLLGVPIAPIPRDD